MKQQNNLTYKKECFLTLFFYFKDFPIIIPKKIKIDGIIKQILEVSIARKIITDKYIPTTVQIIFPVTNNNLKTIPTIKLIIPIIKYKKIPVKNILNPSFIYYMFL